MTNAGVAGSGAQDEATGMVGEARGAQMGHQGLVPQLCAVDAPDQALSAPARRPALRAPWATLETAFFSPLRALPLGTLRALGLGITDIRRRRAASFLFVLSRVISPQVIALA
ncbi:MAG: hypothetical protein KY434_06545, partial [Actinobacteria bacterium]|nr:hypothetical protein [Actinomycetota bacterium]